jgi:NitT/TauT family transport system permease protein
MSPRAFTIIARLGIVLALFGAWELAPRIDLVDIRLLPPLSEVLATLVQLLSTAKFWSHLGVTLSETLVAFMIAVPLGAALGILIAESRFASELFKPLVFFIFSIPKSIFLPIFILMFGITFTQKVSFGVFSTIFIVMMTAFAAIDSVREDHLRVARSYGATMFQTVMRVYLPSMTPVLLEAIRLAMIFNFTGILLAEMYASREGLGNLIGAWGQGYQLKELLAAILLVSAMSILFNELIRYYETKCEHWRS